MTSATEEIRVCTCGTGPNVARCGARHLERTIAKGRTRCPHREDGVKCGQPSHVLKSDATLPPSAKPPSDGGLWPGEDPPAHWREVLGEEARGAAPCDETSGCGCSGPPIRYMSDRTGTACPECGPECWDISPAGAKRAKGHQAMLQQQAARAGRATVAVPQAELDQQARELAVRRAVFREAITHVLKEPHLTVQCRAGWEWFAEQLAGASAARLSDLEDQARAYPVLRHGLWRRSFGTIREYLEWDAGEDEDQDQEEPGNVLQLIPRGELEEISASGDVAELGGYRPCEQCQARGPGSWPAAFARIDSSHPALIPAQDLCEDCLEEQRQLAGRMTYVRMWITTRYAAPAARTTPADPWARYDQIAARQARTVAIRTRGQAVSPGPRWRP